MSEDRIFGLILVGAIVVVLAWYKIELDKWAGDK